MRWRNWFIGSICASLVVAGLAFNVPQASASVDYSSASVVRESGQVHIPQGRVNIRKNPSITAPIIHAVYAGMDLKLKGVAGTWYRIKLSDGRVGYVHNSVSQKVAQQDNDSKPDNVKSASGKVFIPVGTVNVRSTPNLNANNVITKVSAGQELKLTGALPNWFQVKLRDGRTAYVHKSVSKKVSDQPGNTTKGEQIAKYGTRYLGTPYRLGSSSNTTATFDCSSFVQRVFKENGISLPRSAIQQYNASNTRPIAKSQLKPGDLIFTGDSRSPNTIRHVGIYYGDNKIIHTYGPGGVRIDPMRNWLDLNRGWVVAVARVNGVN